MKRCPILYSVIITFLVIGSINCIAFLVLDLCPPFPTDKPSMYFLCQIIGAGLLILLSYKHIKSVFACGTKGFWRGLFLGWPFIVASIVTLVGSLLMTGGAVFVFPTPQEIVLFMIMILFVGIIEEVLFRGVVLKCILKKYGNSNCGIIASIVISSFIFGLAHIVTLVIHPQLIMYTITQVIYCTLAGLLFSIVYLRCQNIFVLIVLHSVIDMSSLLPVLFYPSNKLVLTSDTGFAELVTYVLLHIPFVIVSVVYAKKLMAESCAEAQVV